MLLRIMQEIKIRLHLIVLVQAKPIALFASTKITGNRYVFQLIQVCTLQRLDCGHSTT
jgi:hypothetical protein